MSDNSENMDLSSQALKYKIRIGNVKVVSEEERTQLLGVYIVPVPIHKPFHVNNEMNRNI